MCRPSVSLARQRVLAAFSVLYAASSGAYAQDEASGSFMLPGLVVTATRLPTPESEVASSITVITSDEIERKQERTLPDVLEDVPGLNVIQTGGLGACLSNEVLLDGGAGS
jgi:vitamin B12 transporter